MNLSSLSVRRGVTFAMVFAAIFGFGAYSLSRLQLDLHPEMTFPMVLILTSYSGASPRDVETLVTEPIEGAVAAAKGVESITSESKQGASVVTVEFDWDKDMDQAETDVRRKLEQIVDALPEDASEPLVFAMDPSMQPVVMLTVAGPYPMDELRRIADEDVCDRLERLDGIASCDAQGGLEREIRVAVDPVVLTAFGLDAAAILGAIGRENLQEPGGVIEQGALAFNIQTLGKYATVDDVRKVVVGRKAEASGRLEPILLGQVASVEDAFAEQNSIIEVSGEPAVQVIVRKQSGSNTVKAAGSVMEEIGRIEADRQGRLVFGTIFNQADFINDSLGNLSNTALVGVAITFLVLLFFLRNVRSAAIVATAIPLSVVATFFVMDRAGMTLNVISMAGLALAVGMLVDNAIVVLENIFRLRQEGMSLREAAMNGATEVSTAVTASTLTTVAVFVPVLFVPGIAGVLFRDLALTICFALIVSLLVAVSFIPLAASRLLKGKSGGKDAAALATRRDPVRHLEGPYSRLLGWVLGHRWIVPVGLGAALAMTALLALAMPTEFMMGNDESMVTLTLEAPVGSNLEETTEYAREAVRVVERVVPREERRLVQVESGGGEGFASVFSKGTHSATLRISLVKPSHRTLSQAEYEDRLRDALREIPDLKVSVGGMSLTGGSGDFTVEIKGHDLESLRAVGKDVEKRLMAIPMVAQCEFSFADPTPQLGVRYDRDKMADLGLSTSVVSQAVATYFMGRTAAYFSEGGDEHPIKVRYGKEHRTDVEELGRMPIALPGGGITTLANVATVSIGPGPVSIERVDQERSASLVVTLRDSYTDADGKVKTKDLGKAIAAVRGELEACDWPDDTRYEVGGNAEDFMESFQALGLALLVSVLLVYMVMASQFESFRQPFIILFTIPLALIGVVLMFVLTGSVMDVTALIGVIMLAGIVVNNGIVMVDAANQQRVKGLDRFAAIATAARIRLRPVLLTSLTTICSMIPLALEIGEGAESWSGLARAVIGGLLSATLLTLLVVPTMYTVFARKEVKA